MIGKRGQLRLLAMKQTSERERVREIVQRGKQKMLKRVRSERDEIERHK